MSLPNTLHSEEKQPGFTPGPWEVIEEPVAQNGQEFVILSIQGDGGALAGIHCHPEPTDEDRANARLIATAPELYAACIETERIIGDIVLNADWSGSTPRLTQEQCDAIANLGLMLSAAREKVASPNQEEKAKGGDSK